MAKSSKVRSYYDRDNRTKRSGKRVENLEKQLKELEAKAKEGVVNEKWLADAKGKAMARAKKYGIKTK